MAAGVFFNSFVQYLAEGPFDFDADTLKVALTNTAPTAANTVLADITQITAANGYTSGGATVTVSSTDRTNNSWALVLADTTFTSTGDSMGPLRYAVLYDDTPTSPADPLIAYWDYGSSISLNNTETLTIDWNDTGALFINTA